MDILIIYPAAFVFIVVWLAVLGWLDRRAQRRHDEHMDVLRGNDIEIRYQRWAGMSHERGQL